MKRIRFFITFRQLDASCQPTWCHLWEFYSLSSALEKITVHWVLATVCPSTFSSSILYFACFPLMSMSVLTHPFFMQRSKLSMGCDRDQGEWYEDMGVTTLTTKVFAVGQRLKKHLGSLEKVFVQQDYLNSMSMLHSHTVNFLPRHWECCFTFTTMDANSSFLFGSHWGFFAPHASCLIRYKLPP